MTTSSNSFPTEFTLPNSMKWAWALPIAVPIDLNANGRLCLVHLQQRLNSNVSFIVMDNWENLINFIRFYLTSVSSLADHIDQWNHSAIGSRFWTIKILFLLAPGTYPSSDSNGVLASGPHYYQQFTESELKTWMIICLYYNNCCCVIDLVCSRRWRWSNCSQSNLFIDQEFFGVVL